MIPPEDTINFTVPVRTSGPISLGQERQITLLVYHREGVEAVELTGDRRVIVGRAASADVCVPHPSLSRRHARFTLEDGQAKVVDLDSTNGVRVNGEVVQAAALQPGDTVVLGEVSVSVHVLSPSDGVAAVGLLSHDRFLGHLEEEIVRHRTFGRGLGLIMLRTARGRREHLSRWCPQLQQLLRPVDRVGLYSPSAVEILLPEVSREALGEAARHLVEVTAGEVELRCGAALFPEAATSSEELLEAARTAMQRATGKSQVSFGPATDKHSLEVSGDEVIVRSPAMEKVYTVVKRMQKSSIPVLICGETGTGKEVIARAIYGNDRATPLPCVNCAAIPDQLIESTMFGHEKGAFTGADRQTRGVFEEADGGAVLLDEIGELSPSAQAALLRVLDSKRITRVGSTKEIAVDVRILAATHRNLEAMCEAGSFRWDLLYRINTMTLKVPPLRERPEEIEPLARHFISEANEANGCEVEGIDEEALSALRRYSWPGNVRELRNVIHRSVVMALGSSVLADDLPERVRAGGGPRAVRTTAHAAAPPAPPWESDDDLDYKGRIQRYETDLIRAALDHTDWGKTRAAELLRIPLRTLIYKIKSFGIER